MTGTVAVTGTVTVRGEGGSEVKGAGITTASFITTQRLAGANAQICHWLEEQFPRNAPQADEAFVLRTVAIL